MKGIILAGGNGTRLYPLTMVTSIAEPLVAIALTKKWLFCVPYLRIFCLIYGFYPIHTSNLNAIKALGRNDLFLKLEIIKKMIGMGVLLVTMQYGVMVMAYSLLGTTVISSIINAPTNKKIMNYSYWNQLKDILPGLSLAAVMGIIIWPISLLNLGNFMTIAIQIILGAGVYDWFNPISSRKLLLYRFNN